MRPNLLCIVLFLVGLSCLFLKHDEQQERVVQAGTTSSKSSSANPHNNISSPNTTPTLEICKDSRFKIDQELQSIDKNISCSALTRLESKSEALCKREQMASKSFYSDDKAQTRVKHCEGYFQSINNTANKQASEAELSTPLAFGLLTHGNFGLFEALLASIFRPHNFYCIFIDAKAMPKFQEFVANLVECYKQHYPQSTIFLSNTTHPVFWSHISLLEADLSCLSQLIEADPGNKWKYFFNQAGTVMPMVPIWEMAEKLSNLPPQHDSIMSETVPDRFRYRYLYQFKFRRYSRNAKNRPREVNRNHYLYSIIPRMTRKPNPPPPQNLTIFKGLRESIISRPTVNFLLTSELALEFRQWLQTTAFAEEFFFATLARVNQTIYYKNQTTVESMASNFGAVNKLSARRTLWEEENSECHGVIKRWICNLALGDLPNLYRDSNTTYMFANKLDVKIDPQAIQCLHEQATYYSNP